MVKNFHLFFNLRNNKNNKNYRNEKSLCLCLLKKRIYTDKDLSIHNNLGPSSIMGLPYGRRV